MYGFYARPDPVDVFKPFSLDNEIPKALLKSISECTFIAKIPHTLTLSFEITHLLSKMCHNFSIWAPEKVLK